MLLDIGPKEDGTLDERQEKVLLDLGGWIHDHELCAARRFPSSE